MAPNRVQACQRGREIVVNVVEVEDVSKRFSIRKQKSLKESVVNARRAKRFKEDFTALNGVSLAIASGESVGLMGPNGSGKSTLLKIIGGILAPSQGTVRVRGRLAALLELGAGFHPDLSGRENVFLNASILGLTNAETTRYFDEIVDFSGIEEFIDTQVKFYSSGMYVRLAFAVAVHVDPDVLLVDEVLAVGDEPFQQKCMNKIREFQADGRTIVLVSHSAAQVADVCNRAIILEHGNLVEDSTPRVAISRLRKDYQGQMEADRKASADPASYKATIRAVSVQASGATPGTGDIDIITSPGKDLTVHGEIDFAQPTQDWELVVIVENYVGGLAFGTDTRIMRATLPEVNGRASFTMTFPELQIGDGEYAVNVAVRDRYSNPLDSISQAATFGVRTGGRTVGQVFTEPVVAINDLPVPSA